MKNYRIQFLIANLLFCLNLYGDDITYDDYVKSGNLNLPKNVDPFVGWLQHRFENNLKSSNGSHTKDILESITNGKGVKFTKTRPATKEELKIIKSLSHTLLSMAKIDKISLDDLKGNALLDNSKYINGVKKKIDSFDNAKITEAVNEAKGKNLAFYLRKKNNEIKFHNEHNTNFNNIKNEKTIPLNPLNDEVFKKYIENIEKTDFYKDFEFATKQLKGNDYKEAYFPTYNDDPKDIEDYQPKNEVFDVYRLYKAIKKENPFNTFFDGLQTITLDNRVDFDEEYVIQDNGFKKIQDKIKEFMNLVNQEKNNGYENFLSIFQIKEQSETCIDNIIIYMNKNDNKIKLILCNKIDTDGYLDTFIKNRLFNEIKKNNIDFSYHDTFYTPSGKNMTTMIILNELYEKGPTFLPEINSYLTSNIQNATDNVFLEKKKQFIHDILDCFQDSNMLNK